MSACIKIQVHLRAPRAGERGWWVQDVSSPLAALREVVRESEELGWVAPYDFHWSPDAEGMWPVTVEVLP